MPTIAAANNLTIDIENGSWSLLNGQADNAPPVVQAREDGLNYRPSFATARRLSPDGRLSPDQIAMVVVGWAVEDSSWHLGIMVTPDVAQTRGGRWCGLARWANNDADSAKEAGEALATTLHKPFRLVPPTENEQLTIASAPILPGDTALGPSALTDVESAPPQAPVPLMPLPISLGEWELEQDDEDLICHHSSNWRRRAVLNTAFLFVLTLIFAALSFGSFFSPFAPVQPDWLPYVGFALTALLVVLFVRQIVLLFRATSLLIDNHERVIRVMRGFQSGRKSGRTLLLSPYEGIDYVLISHVLSRRETATPYDRIWPEVWIHLFSPRRGFIAVAYVSETQGTMRSGLTFETRRALDLHDIDTPAHHVALHIAEVMGIPAYVEGR